MTERVPPWNASPDVDARVEALLQHFSLEEKIDLVSGNVVVADDRHPSPPSSPIPAFSLSDGPAGVRRAGQTANATALPAPIALAATWDPDLARQYGEIIGAEARANGRNVLLGPAVDIARAPLAGRTFESFGEDPLLQARLVSPEIQAIQAHPVQACIKHYLVNNQEYQRGTIDARVDERALQQIYLQPFRAAVQEGQVASAMAAYNRINGTYACENSHTLTTLLREQLGFRGWVMSDFMANHSTAESANAGLDWELARGGVWGPHLLAAVRAGHVRVETIDTMVRRILRPTIGLGLLDHPLELRQIPVQRHGEQARAIAEAGIVLLKNAGGLLPLATGDLRSIAVIGPDADNISAAGGGSALVPPAYGVSPLEGIRRRAGDGVRVAYAPGADPIGAGVLLPGPPAVPSAVLTPAGPAPAEHGLLAEYWANPDLAGEPALVRTEPRAEMNRGFFDLPGLNAASPKLTPTPADLPGRMSVRWSGQLTPPTTGDYTLSLTSLGRARLTLDQQVLINTGAGAGIPAGASALGVAGSAVQVATSTVHLVSGRRSAVTIEYAADAPGQSPFKEALVRFGWQPPTGAVTPLVAAAVALARQSDVAIVVARTFESEEMDRPDLRLPNEQDVLIRAVAAANPRTVVVLMTGGPVETASWEDSTPAVVQAWYAGQEQGNAIARVLFGDVNPTGKLPLTFPRSEAHTPLATPRQYPGVDGAVHYSEGIFVGYRGYERLGIRPQYPFGHGLSYTSFAYDEVQVTPETTDGTRAIQVRFAVTNTGGRAGTETAQVYLGLPAAAGEPPKRLVGWARVPLGPGERRLVTVTLDPHSAEQPLSCWDASTHRWEMARGAHQVYVGASSQDIRCHATLTVDPPQREESSSRTAALPRA
jgi:beta-glucosidase